MDDNKIKEAFEKWFPNQVTEQELAFGIECTVGIRAEDIHAMQVAGINFHGGYTSRDAEIEQLEKDIFNLKVKCNTYAQRLVLEGFDDVEWEVTNGPHSIFFDPTVLIERMKG